MLEEFVYVNHMGGVFGSQDVFVKSCDLRDYSWNYDTLNSKISRFYRPITKRKITLAIVGTSEQWGSEDVTFYKNELFAITEMDVEAKIPGYVWIGDFWTRGYIIASKKRNYLVNSRYCEIELTLVSDDPAWYRDYWYEFYQTPRTDAGEGYDYPFEYPYGYSTKSKTTQYIDCDSISGNEFDMYIYGPVTNPSIKIGEHEYSINGTVGPDEMLKISSLDKKITLYTPIGEELNWFDRRSRDSYIFEKIPSGYHTVSWDGSFGFELGVIEKRSEPEWT